MSYESLLEMYIYIVNDYMKLLNVFVYTNVYSVLFYHIVFSSSEVRVDTRTHVDQLRNTQSRELLSLFTVILFYY